MSIPSNVAEGSCRKSDRVYLNHVAIALGSHAELETLIEVSRQLDYLKAADLEQVTDLCTKTGQLLNGLHRSLERRSVMNTN